jgi:hypothetical protein
MLAALTAPVQQIVDAADRAAAAMRQQAAAAREADSGEGQTSPQADLTEALLARTQDLRAQADSLAALLERASGQLSATSASETQVADAPAPAAQEASPPTPPGPEPVSVTDRPAPVAPATVRPPGSSPGGRFVPRGRTERTEANKPTLPNSSTQGIRLLATQMAVAGSTRDEVEHRLESEFGISDADDILDDVMGAA